MGFEAHCDNGDQRSLEFVYTKIFQQTYIARDPGYQTQGTRPTGMQSLASSSTLIFRVAKACKKDPNRKQTQSCGGRLLARPRQRVWISRPLCVKASPNSAPPNVPSKFKIENPYSRSPKRVPPFSETPMCCSSPSRT